MRVFAEEGLRNFFDIIAAISGPRRANRFHRRYIGHFVLQGLAI